MSRAQRQLHQQRQEQQQRQQQGIAISERETAARPRVFRPLTNDDAMDVLECPACDSPNFVGEAYIGTLGSLHHFRCRYCAWPFNINACPEEGTDAPSAITGDNVLSGGCGIDFETEQHANDCPNNTGERS